MLPREVPPAFEREQGCTEAEWLMWLPGAVRGAAIARPAADRARLAVAAGHLDLQWRPLPPRQIALLRMPRLHVAFRFEGVDDAGRSEFMRYFDLYMQRGGG